MKMKFKELPVFWRRLIAILTAVTVLLAVTLISYIWISFGSLIRVMF